MPAAGVQTGTIVSIGALTFGSGSFMIPIRTNPLGFSGHTGSGTTQGVCAYQVLDPLLEGQLREMQLCFHSFWNNRHTSVRFVESHDTVLKSEKREVTTHAYIDARVILCPALADNDVSGNHSLTAIFLDAQHFWIAVPAVAGGSLSFLMCHG